LLDDKNAGWFLRAFSLLMYISVEFGTGIQLGFGFTAAPALGGILGLNAANEFARPSQKDVRTGRSTYHVPAVM